MIDVLKLFYTTHYNLGAVAILLLMLLIFFLSKKNFKGAISWTIEIDPPAATPNEYGSYSEAQPIKMTFTATPEKWTITDSKGETHHWCWVDAMWDKFANTDLVAKIWGENSSKKMMKSTESRASDIQGN